MKKELLNDLFTTVTKKDGEVLPCYALDYMNSDNADKYAVYQAVSTAQRESGLSFNFSYEVAKLAVDVLIDTDDWTDTDTLSQQIDSAVPIYTSEVMTVYLSDGWAVDEAIAEMGNIENVEQGAKMAWYRQIEQMLQAIITNLKD